MRIIRGFLLGLALLLAPSLASAAYTCTATYTCASTQYWTGAKCDTCPAGYKCAGGTINVVDGVLPAESGRTPCSAAGEYQDATGQTTCKSVAAGYYKVSNSERTACAANYFCTGDGYRQACPTEYPNAAAGTASINATACYKNEDYNALGQTYCSAGVKKTNAASFSGGAQSTSGYTKTWTTQPTATAGTTAATTAFKAKAGSFVSGTFACGQCTGASFTDAENTKAACDACPTQTDGWTRNGGTGWSAVTSCNQTKTGNAINQYCSGGVLRQNATNATTWGAAIIDTPLQAAAGSLVNGQTCAQCGVGTFTATSGPQTSCDVCAADSYANAVGATGCAGCLANYHTTGTTAADHDNANDCKITCPAGSYLSAANNTACAVCPTGKYQTTATTIAQGGTNACAGTCPATYDYNPGTTADKHDAETDCQTECQPGNYIAAAN
ncbi:MAG: hypothetical protein LBL46_04515, partial [Rickettsiales bacterium]|nr:hypothetical protein [Rickettsiales bacterium]